MRAAIVVEGGQAPVYTDFREPVAQAGYELVEVRASALSPVVRSRASGSHYSAESESQFVVGVDGIGVRVHDRRLVYFLMPEAPFGSMAERTLVDANRIIELPEGLDAVTAAAMAIPGMSSWAALKERAHFVAGETVLVNGATGTSGRLAIQVAKHLGAARVIATGRDPAKLRELETMGVDRIVVLEQDDQTLGESLEALFRERVDVVLDYLWGPSAEAVLMAAAKGGIDGVPIRYIQIGSASGTSIALPSAVLRSSSLELRGSGINSVPLPRILRSIADFFDAAVLNDYRAAVQIVPLSEVAAAWSRAVEERIVFTMG